MRWIDIRNLDVNALASNPNAVPMIEALLSDSEALTDVQKLQLSGSDFWCNLSANPAAIHLLEQYPERIDYINLSRNPAAIHLLEQRPKKIDWQSLATNPAALPLIERYSSKMDPALVCYNPALDEATLQRILEHFPRCWEYISRYPHAIGLLLKTPRRINWRNLSSNPHPVAMNWLIANQDKIDWHNLSANPAAIELITANQDKISWCSLSSNPDPAALELLRQNQDKIDWQLFSANPAIFCDCMSDCVMDEDDFE